MSCNDCRKSSDAEEAARLTASRLLQAVYVKESKHRSVMCSQLPAPITVASSSTRRWKKCRSASVMCLCDQGSLSETLNVPCGQGSVAVSDLSTWPSELCQSERNQFLPVCCHSTCSASAAVIAGCFGILDHRIDMWRHIRELQVKPFALHETPYSCCNSVKGAWECAVTPHLPAKFAMIRRIHKTHAAQVNIHIQLMYLAITKP